MNRLVPALVVSGIALMAFWSVVVVSCYFAGVSCG